MNVQVLGNDVCYGNSPNTIFRKQRREVMLGGNVFTDFFSSIGKAVSSDTGKAVTAAVLTTTAQRMTPTQKANLAIVQEAAGIPAQVVTGGGSTTINLPGKTELSSALPYIIGGVALLGLFAVIAMKK
jgi:hypothetical protein